MTPADRGHAEPPASSSAPPTAPPFRFAGVALGDPISTFEQTPGIRDTLCDRDPIDHKRRTIWFHGACNHARPLPGKILVTAFTKSESPDSKVDAISWAFGAWPAMQGFDGRIGATSDELNHSLGPGTRVFDFDGVLTGGAAIVVFAHPNDVFSVQRGEKAIGFVVGKMGRDRTLEEWSGLFATFLRYEPK